MSGPNKPNSHWSRRHTKVTRQKLRERIGAYSVEPFADAIAYLLGSRPDQKSLQDWANKNPDKWANAISIFSKLYGFAEYKVIDHNHHFDPTKLSDMELKARLAALRENLTPLIEANPVESNIVVEETHKKTPGLELTNPGASVTSD